jgi:protein-tyrosine phosphatase
MAEYLAKGVEAKSAGVYAEVGEPMTPGARKAIGGAGAGHRAQQVTEEHLKWADVVLAMTRDHVRALTSRFPAYKDKIRMLKNTDVEDPYGQSDSVYAATAAEIKEALDEFLAKTRS